MSAWLQRQRKQRLLELAEEAGYKTDGDSLKDEIIQGLDKHLQANATQLAGNSSFETYYGSRRTPFKARVSTATAGATSDEGEVDVKPIVKPAAKRPSKPKPETVVETAAAAIATPVQTVTTAATKFVEKVSSAATSTATPSQPTVVARRTPVAPRHAQLPASPRDVADQVEYQTEKLYAGIDEAFTGSGIPQALDHLRDLCSSVMGVQMTAVLLEAFALQKHIFPWRFLTDIPWVAVLGMPERLPVRVPDFFVLLTGYFWSTTLLWSATSILVPSLFAYFYNLTTRDIKKGGNTVSVSRHVVDPFTFSIVKALLTYIVYSRGSTFGGIISSDAATRVSNAMFGGSTGAVLGAIVCALASLYEAAQRG